VKLQVQKNTHSSQYKGVWDAGRQTWAQRGLVGLYRGILPTILRDIPAFAAYFGTYETLKTRLLLKLPNTSDKTIMFFSGGCAGIAAWLVSYPQDLIKSRMQSNSAYTSTADCVRQIVKQNGWKVHHYFKGFGPTILRAFPANAATFLAYEMTMTQLRSMEGFTPLVKEML
jgi:solute carrier family 25 carnitine/acylcarnitine transporter 20/29